MPAKHGPELLKTAFDLLAERGWAGFSFAEVARRAGTTLDAVYAELPDRSALLRMLGRRLDAGMLALDLAELDGMNVRERLFELIMRRLDGMADYKDGLRMLARRPALEPVLLATACGNLDRLSRRLLDAAGADHGPVLAMLARRVVGGIYLCTFRVWLDDDTPDMARTLAELDRRLQQAETLARWTAGIRRLRRRTPAENQAAG
ncbi:MAG: TetR family transcriptional regulator [Geminicoccaceae bacterium]